MNRPVSPVASGRIVQATLTLVFLGAHIPLALAMRSHPSLSTVHALATLAVGLVWAVSGRHPGRVAAVGAYLAGSEVLWRMTGADFFWEGAKYATVLIFSVALLRSRRLRAPLSMVAYFALLLPSTVRTWVDLGPSQARSPVSFNLSGPLALAVSVWFFSHLRVSRDGLAHILASLIAPIVGVFAISFFGTVTAYDISFGAESNFLTSGGFGPNQVSAVLGLGALAAFILAFDDRRPLAFRASMLALLLALGAQSALTFSRTGVVALLICVGAGLVFLARIPRVRMSLLLGLPLLAAMAALVVVPRLEAFTHGAIVDRFLDTNPTGRDQLAEADLLIFLDHPVLGVGPGQAKALREVTGRVGVAHTEFTRMLSEHGVLGLAALILMLSIAARRFLAARGPGEKAIVAMLFTWSLLFMLVGGMRIVAPSFVFGLASAMPSRGRRARKVAPPVPGSSGLQDRSPIPRPMRLASR